MYVRKYYNYRKYIMSIGITLLRIGLKNNLTVQEIFHCLNNQFLRMSHKQLAVQTIYNLFQLIIEMYLFFKVPRKYQFMK